MASLVVSLCELINRIFFNSNCRNISSASASVMGSIRQNTEVFVNDRSKRDHILDCILKLKR